MARLTYAELERRIEQNEKQIAELGEIIRRQAESLAAHYTKLAERLPVHPALAREVDKLIASTGLETPKRLTRVRVVRHPDDPQLSPEATRERQLRRRHR